MSNQHNNIFEPGTVKPEEDYLELERLGSKLGIPVPMTYITVETTNPDGSPGTRYHDRSRTWNRNFWNYTFTIVAEPSAWTGSTFAAGSLSMKQTNATINNPTPPSYVVSQIYPTGFVGAGGTTNNTTVGIIVGTGSTAESFEGFVLATPIASGTTAGTLSYGAQPSYTAAYDTPTKTWSVAHRRTFTNSSGGSIVVAETGIYTYSASPAYSHMISRDVLSAAQTVLNGGVLTVTYTMSMTFPA